MGIITLLTDFGTKDEYVGVLKGVILKIHSDVDIVDITHHIQPQNVEQAGEMLNAAYAWFPEGTIHLVIVDPGVGSERAVIAARQAGHTFVAPDNGVLTAVLGSGKPETTVRVEKRELFLNPVSHTFHGRDIFAPVAAHLSLGMDIQELGPTVEPSTLVHLETPQLVWTSETELLGQVTGSDRFGNVLTNIDALSLDRLSSHSHAQQMVFTIAGQRIVGLTEVYFGHGPKELIALIGSRNRLEFAINGGNAAQVLKPSPGMPVTVKIQVV